MNFNFLDLNGQYRSVEITQGPILDPNISDGFDIKRISQDGYIDRMGNVVVSIEMFLRYYENKPEQVKDFVARILNVKNYTNVKGRYGAIGNVVAQYVFKLDPQDQRGDLLPNMFIGADDRGIYDWAYYLEDSNLQVSMIEGSKIGMRPTQKIAKSNYDKFCALNVTLLN